jgi:hypothetical protein
MRHALSVGLCWAVIGSVTAFVGACALLDRSKYPARR